MALIGFVSFLITSQSKFDLSKWGGWIRRADESDRTLHLGRDIEKTRPAHRMFVGHFDIRALLRYRLITASKVLKDRDDESDLIRGV